MHQQSPPLLVLLVEEIGRVYLEREVHLVGLLEHRFVQLRSKTDVIRKQIKRPPRSGRRRTDFAFRSGVFTGEEHDSLSIASGVYKQAYAKRAHRRGAF